MSYAFINITAKPAPLDTILDETGAYTRGARAETALAMAAPELKAALQFYVAICGNTCAVVDRKSAHDAYEMARAALAKVTP